MQTFRAVFAVGLFFFATGATDCSEYFSDVTVPATDRTAPTPFGAIRQGDEYKVVQSGEGTFTYRTRPGERLDLITGGMDEGGVAEVRMSGMWALHCCVNGQSECGQTFDFLPPITSTQPGDVGDRVSNGIWVGRRYTMPSCANGRTTFSRVSFWSVTKDFHGNEIHSPAYAAEWRD